MRSETNSPVIWIAPGKRNSVAIVLKVPIAASLKLSPFWACGFVKEKRNAGLDCPKACV